MKHVKITFLICALSVLCLSSCEKCRTCTFQTQFSQRNPSDHIKSNCGSQDDLNAWEQQIQDEIDTEDFRTASGRILNFTCYDE